MSDGPLSEHRRRRLNTELRLRRRVVAAQEAVDDHLSGWGAHAYRVQLRCIAAIEARLNADEGGVS
jgi:hypothetical protein